MSFFTCEKCGNDPTSGTPRRRPPGPFVVECKCGNVRLSIGAPAPQTFEEAIRQIVREEIATHIGEWHQVVR